ncbi:unnamed protein product [Orchesella dallaii]|uniref:Uncharacterized protein n=1 Tax=Orchesella dallaii TaxID=48710 RepID=A0ABP1PQJ9_9HEXA
MSHKDQNRVLEKECKQLRSQLKEAQNETLIAERKYMDLEEDMDVLFICCGDSSDTDSPMEQNNFSTGELAGE